jgi:hypothetical protein
MATIVLDDVVLGYCGKFKKLGIFFDKNLINWQGQISQITQKFYGALKTLEKFRDVTVILFFAT